MKQLADKLRFIRSGGYYFRDPFAAILTNNLLAVYETIDAAKRFKHLFLATMTAPE